MVDRTAEISRMPQIASKFYKIGEIGIPTTFPGFDSHWKVFDSLSQAVNQQIGSIIENEGKHSKTEINTQELEVLDKKNFEGFIQKFGYNPDVSVFRKVDKNHFACISQIGQSTVIELLEFNDFEEHYESINGSNKISVEGIIVSSANKTVALTSAFKEQGFFVLYYSQNSAIPQYVRHRRSGIESISSYPIGAIANLDSNPFAALELLHEYRHVYQPELTEYQSEVDAYEYALQMKTFLSNEGINLTPRISQQQAKSYLEKNLLGYAKKHYPVRTFIRCALNRFSKTK